MLKHKNKSTIRFFQENRSDKLPLTTSERIYKIFPVTGQYEAMAVMQFMNAFDNKPSIAYAKQTSNSGTDKQQVIAKKKHSAKKYRFAALAPFKMKIRSESILETATESTFSNYYKSTRTHIGTYKPHVLPNGFYFACIEPGYCSDEKLLSELVDVNSTGNEFIQLNDALDPSLSAIVIDTDQKMALISASKDKQTLYLYELTREKDYSLYLYEINNESDHFHWSIHSGKKASLDWHWKLTSGQGEPIYQIKDDLTITALATLPGSPTKIAVATNDGKICVMDYNVDNKCFALIAELEIGRGEVELFFSANGILIGYNHAENALLVWDTQHGFEFEQLNTFKEGRLNQLHLSLDATLLTALLFEENHTAEQIYLYDFIQRRAQIIKLSKPVSDLVVLDPERLCYADENTMHYTNNFLQPYLTPKESTAAQQKHHHSSRFFKFLLHRHSTYQSLPEKEHLKLKS